MARRLLSGMVIGPGKDFVSSTPKRKVASVGQVPDWFLNSVGVMEYFDLKLRLKVGAFL